MVEPTGKFLVVADLGNHRLRRIDLATREVTTIAGSGQKGYTGDGGPALKATFNLPHEIRFDQAGDLYIVDMGNNAVRKVALKTGVITTFAGTGKAGYSGDGGPARDATFNEMDARFCQNRTVTPPATSLGERMTLISS